MSTNAAEIPKLEKPPIVEALLAICGPSTAAWDSKTLPDRIRAVLPDYPQVELFNSASVSFQFQPNANPQVGQPATATSAFEDKGWEGIRLATAEPSRTIVVQRGMVLLSWLAPYPGWSSLRDEMLRIWRLLGPVLEFSRVDRVETRYINQLEVPIENGWVDFPSYFTGIGTPPKGMKWGPFVNQVMLAVAEDPLVGVNLVRMAQPPSTQSPTTVPLVLDLMATRNEHGNTEEGRLRAVFSALHDLKNHVFFESVSERFLALCRKS